MKVLWIARAGSSSTFKAVVQNQFSTFSKFSNNIRVIHFTVKGNSAVSYLQSALPFIRFIIKTKPDVIHAHYSYSAFFACLLFPFKPIVVSLMGSDVEGGKLRKILIQICSKIFWNRTIVKSESLKENSGVKNLVVLPNGVDLYNFKLLDPIACKEKLEWDKNKIQILFLADPKRREKNFDLAKESFIKLNDEKTELKVIFNQPIDSIPFIINAADIILLTSLWEGSPNVVKEAMACNCPVVSTRVGDVEWLFGDEPGHFLTSFEPDDVAAKIELAIDFLKKNIRTNGRKRILDLELDSVSVTKQIIEIYKEVINC